MVMLLHQLHQLVLVLKVLFLLRLLNKKLARKNELKAKSTLLLAIPDEHLLKIHGIKDAKTLWEAIKTRFRGNKKSKKMQKTILKQQYENFAASRSEGLHKTYDRFQKLISKLEMHGEVISQEDANLKLLRSGHAYHEGEKILKEDRKDIVQFNGKETSLQKQYDQQREALNKANIEIICYQMGLESLEARIVVHQKNGAVFEEDIAFLKYDVKVRDNSITELKNQLEEALKEKDDLKLKLEKFEESSKNLTKLINSQISAKDKTGIGYDGQMNENELNNIYMNESEVVHSVFNSRDIDVDDNSVNDRFKTCEGFHAVPPPYTGNYMPPRPDLSFARLDNSVFMSKMSETITSKDSLEKPKTVRSSAHLIEEWESDSEDENVFKPKEVKKTAKPSFEKIEFVNARNSTVEKPWKFSQSPSDNKRNWNGLMTQRLGDGFEFKKKACFVCGSFNHLIKDCDFHDNKMVEKPVLNKKGRVTSKREIRPVWNNAQRVNHQNKLTHPHPKRNFVPTAILTKSGQVPVDAAKQKSHRVAVSISAARRIYTAAPRPNVNDVLPTTYSYFNSHSLKQGYANSTNRVSTVSTSVSAIGQSFINSRIYLDDEYVDMTCNKFLQYTRLEIPEFRDTLIQHMESVKKSIDERAQHKREYDSWVNERQIQTTEGKVDTGKAVDASLVNTESIRTESKEQDTSSRSGNDAHADDADIRPIYDEEPMVEVQTTAEINIFATGQQHTEQPEFNNEGKVDQNVEQCHDTCPLPAKLTDNQTTELSNQSLESENIRLKKTVAQFQKDFLRMEAHCVNLELKYQNQALKEGQHGQFLKVTSNEAKHSSLGLNDLMVSAENNTSGTVPQFQKTFGSYSRSASDFMKSRLIITSVQASPNVNTGFLELNAVGPSTSTARSNKEDNTEEEPEVDLGNITNSYIVPNTPNTRIHKDHLIDNVIGEVQSTVQTRRMLKPTFEQGFLSDVYEQKTHDTLNTCLYACFLSQIKPTSIGKALSDSSWVEAMQEELLQFNLQQVWILVDLPNGKKAIGTKWGKIDQHYIIKKQKGDILLYKSTVDEIIFGSNKNKEFMYSGFEKLMKDKFQMSFMGELTFFLGLQVQQKEDGIFIIQDKYKPLSRMEDAMMLMYNLYRSYDWVFECISRHLDQYHVCSLWYSRDSPFKLFAYTDSDYAGATLDRKSIIGGCQFLGNSLISWQCKKQTVVATSTTKAEYVAATSYCG
ncbi:hypothetical protein Tco_0089061 [Tanacetum coccineum]